MNLYGPAFFPTNDALEAEIRQLVAARKDVANNRIGKIQGEGRMMEFVSTADSILLLDTNLREAMAEARRRGMAIGDGTAGSAIAVEIG